jgi:ketosteroid isomerase-like protein
MMGDADYQIEEEITRLEHQWIDAVARRDPAALDRIIADDYLIAGWLPDGRLGDKQFYIEDCLKPVNVEQSSYNLGQWKVRAYGDVAVVNCRFECRALVDGQPWGGMVLFTDVWVRDGGRWKVAARHSSPVVEATGLQG